MTAEKRSALMSRIRGKDTAPELILRQLLWQKGLRYRLHDRKLPGRPDLVFAGRKVAVFVHGCFWHRHEGCPYFRLPKTRPEFWDAKLQRNRERDLAAIRTIIDLGWRAGVVWECSIRRSAESTSDALAHWMETGNGNISIEACGRSISSIETPQFSSPY
nr:very short patch repair endonuclease [Xanthomonas arboricola]